MNFNSVVCFLRCNITGWVDFVFTVQMKTLSIVYSLKYSSIWLIGLMSSDCNKLQNLCFQQLNLNIPLTSHFSVFIVKPLTCKTHEVACCASGMHTVSRWLWQLHQSSLVRIQKYNRSLCHTSPIKSLSRVFQVRGPFRLKYKIHQTVNMIGFKELSVYTALYLRRVEVWLGPFSGAGYFWYWSKLQLRSLNSCCSLLSFFTVGVFHD